MSGSSEKTSFHPEVSTKIVVCFPTLMSWVKESQCQIQVAALEEVLDKCLVNFKWKFLGVISGNRARLESFMITCNFSANMLAYAIDRSKNLNDSRVRYLLADAVEYKFEPSSFDFVYSRDCVQHIDELQRLFKNIYVSLKHNKIKVTTCMSRTV